MKMIKFTLLVLSITFLGMFITSCSGQSTGLESLPEHMSEIASEDVSLEESLESEECFSYGLGYSIKENPFDLEDRIGFRVYKINNGSVVLDVPMFDEYFFPGGVALAEFNLDEVLRDGEAIIMHGRAQQSVQVRIEDVSLSSQSIEDVLENAVNHQINTMEERFGVTNHIIEPEVRSRGKAVLQKMTREEEGVLVIIFIKVAEYMGYPVIIGVQVANIWGLDEFDYWFEQIKEVYGFSKFFEE